MNLRGQQIVQRMFKALTEKDQENRGVRRPVTFANLCAVARTDDEEVTKADKDDLKTIIDCFRAEGRSFLMPPIGKTPHEKTLSDEAVIDISHESLIRNWKGSENNKRLREWIDEETQSAHTYRRLYETALLHQNRKEEMLRGVSLKSMLEWQDRQKPTVAWARSSPLRRAAHAAWTRRSPGSGRT